MGSPCILFTTLLAACNIFRLGTSCMLSTYRIMLYRHLWFDWMLSLCSLWNILCLCLFMLVFMLVLVLYAHDEVADSTEY